MHVNDILTAMRQRMFTPELTNSLLAAYWKELEEEEEEDEIEFQRSHRILEEKLTPVQKDILRDMEVLCAKNVDYALEFAFHRGVYISFEKLFVENTEKHPFTELVCSKILHNPEMQTLFPYASTRDQFNQCASLLEEQLEKEWREHITTIYCGWDDRLYAVLRHGFYLGYRYGLYIMDQVRPVGSMGDMAGKILLTEHELAFTLTGEERERRQAILARRRAHRENASAEEQETASPSSPAT